nr:MAG TPA: hypothetical protein [Bacteriophage sp.]
MDDRSYGGHQDSRGERQTYIKCVFATGQSERNNSPFAKRKKGLFLWQSIKEIQTSVDG